jgi:predicted amidophosphoribosyltransferase
LKYRNDQSRAEPLAEAAAEFLARLWTLDAIVPVPPSNTRKSQPVMTVADGIARRLGVPLCAGCLTKVKQTPQLKDITDYDKRMEVLSGAFSADPNLTRGRRLLLFDDLYGSGATVGHIAEVLKRDGLADSVFLLTLTTK